MTTQELIDYYVGLLIMQYVGMPKAEATIEALVTMAIMDKLPLLVQEAYSIDTAVGDQLDVIGKYAGVTRDGYDFVGPASLTDADFRVFIRMAILQNNAGSALADIQNLISLYFPNTLRVFDNKNMQMNYYLDSDAGSQQLAQFFVKQGLLPKPMGVELGALIYAADIDHFFGCRSYVLEAYNVSPFNTYDSYQSSTPWLSYANAIYE